METRRLRLLVELRRLGSMRAVAETIGTTTSTVSQQLGVLGQEMGAALTEPDGRRVRLTPAGRRLAEHAEAILAAVDAARLDLAPGAEPNGMLRVAGFATAMRTRLLPLLSDLSVTHPRLHVLVREHEPAEALALLAADEVDLALTYDYNLAPVATDPEVHATPLWAARWGLGVPADADIPDAASSREIFARLRAQNWIVNSRNTADETVIRTLASLAGFTPRITHQADTLDLVQGMISTGIGVGLLPIGLPTFPGVRLLPLTDPHLELRATGVARLGRRAWPAIAVVTELLARPAPHAS